jgi:hypothetical protein
MVALVTQLILNLIGIGLGAASFDPTSNANPSGSTFSVAAGIWWALSGILAALAGGYTAAFRTLGTVAGGAAQTLGSTAQTAAQAVAPRWRGVRTPLRRSTNRSGAQAEEQAPLPCGTPGRARGGSHAAGQKRHASERCRR